jgi:hypothetical protein
MEEAMIGNTANIAIGEQVTDVLGEVVMDLPPSRPWRHQVGELRLMAAVLEDAINIVRKRPRSRAGREAREWLSSRDATWPFAFERICDALDLDADSVRRQVHGPRPARPTFEAADVFKLAETA